jgi:hypothetical protein
VTHLATSLRETTHSNTSPCAAFRVFSILLTFTARLCRFHGCLFSRIVVLHSSATQSLTMCTQISQQRPTPTYSSRFALTSNMSVLFCQGLDMSKMQPTAPQTSYYGHTRRQATKCGHIIHASASQHTPLCPGCISSQSKAGINLALKDFLEEGGLNPGRHMRARRWQRAKRRYEIMKERQEKVRIRDQLREEREQAWEEAHQRFNLEPLQAITTAREPAGCPACAAMTSDCPTEFSATHAARDRTWWERPGGLVADHILVRSSPSRPVRPAQRASRTRKGSLRMRTFIRDSHRAMKESDANRLLWETRYRTESAVRRKHSLGEEYRFRPEFWDVPVSASLSRKSYQQAQDERKARGNTKRPKPPSSSLSHVERSEEIEIDEAMLDQMRRTEEQESLERQIRKVGEEVGYLYFVGGVDGLEEWSDDYVKSDRQLVKRKFVPTAKPSENGEHGSDTEEDEDSSEEDNSDEDKSEEDEVSSGKMEVDE